jgi:hypothetical protein
VARLCNKVEHKLPAAAQPREVLAAEDVLAKPTAAGSR